MKTVISIFPALALVFFSCSKGNTPRNVNDSLPQGTVLFSGSFSGNAHPTSGTVKVIRDAAGINYLVFENFSSDNGPDLDVWLAPDISGSTYQSLGDLKAINGNFYYELGSSVDLSANNRVLIWCVRFSVLFGHATLE